MDNSDRKGIPFTGFPIRKPEMQIGAPPANPYRPAAEESDFSRDTQAWD